MPAPSRGPDRGPTSSGSGSNSGGSSVTGSRPGFGNSAGTPDAAPSAPPRPVTAGEAENPRDGQLRPLHNGPDRKPYARFPEPYRPGAARPSGEGSRPGALVRPSGPSNGSGTPNVNAPGDRMRGSTDLNAVPSRYPGPRREVVPAMDEVRGSLQRLSDRQRYGRGPLERLSRPGQPQRPATPALQPAPSRQPGRSPALASDRARLNRTELTPVTPEGRRRGQTALTNLRREQERNPVRAEAIRNQAQRLANLRADMASVGANLAAGPVAGSVVRRRLGSQGLLPGQVTPGGNSGGLPGNGDGGGYPDTGNSKGLWYGGGYQPGWSFGFGLGYGYGCGLFGAPFSFCFGSSWFWWNYWNHPCFGPNGYYYGWGGGWYGGWCGGYSPWSWWSPYPWYSWYSNPTLYYAAAINSAPAQPTTVIIEQAAPATVIVEQAPAEPAPIFVPSPSAAAAPQAPSQPMGPAGERYLTLGDRAFRDGRYGDAAHYYGKAVEAEPTSGVLHLVLADALFATGDYTFAAAAIRKAFELDQSLVYSTIDKRGFYRDGTDFDAQLAVLELYLLDHPDDQDAQLVLALNYLFGNAPARAVDFLATRPRGEPSFDLIRGAAEEVQFGRAAEVK